MPADCSLLLVVGVVYARLLFVLMFVDVDVVVCLLLMFVAV